jgi:hypothetical protein
VTDSSKLLAEHFSVCTRNVFSSKNVTILYAHCFLQDQQHTTPILLQSVMSFLQALTKGSCIQFSAGSTALRTCDAKDRVVSVIYDHLDLCQRRESGLLEFRLSDARLRLSYRRSNFFPYYGRITVASVGQILC